MSRPSCERQSAPDAQGRSTAAARQRRSIGASLPKHAWRTITWRKGTNAEAAVALARVRVRAAATAAKHGRLMRHCSSNGPRTRPRPPMARNPRPQHVVRDLIDIAQLRWRIERDDQDLKQEIGLGHYEGRGWQGFHHHGTLSIAAYGFLISERRDSPLSTTFRRSHRKICRSQRLSTPRRPRSGRNATSPTRSQRSIACWPSRLQRPSTMPVLHPLLSAEPATKIMMQ